MLFAVGSADFKETAGQVLKQVGALRGYKLAHIEKTAKLLLKQSGSDASDSEAALRKFVLRLSSASASAKSNFDDEASRALAVEIYEAMIREASDVISQTSSKSSMGSNALAALRNRQVWISIL